MMKSLVSRFKAFALLLAVAAYGGARAADYTYSNVDSDSLASWSDPSYGTQTFQFKLNAPSAKLAVGNFPSSGYVQLTSISLSARSNQSGYTGATKAILTNDKTSESYTATVAYNQNAFSASMNPSLISDSTRREWTRMEVLMTFSTDGVLVDTDATYTLTFKNASDANVTMGYSVVKNDSLSIGWTPAMRIYGRTPSGSMEMPSSLIPSSGGMALPSTVTVADATDMAFANDSVTIGNSGIQIALASSINNQTVMVQAVIPSSSSCLIGWMTGQYQSQDIENCAYYDGSNFNQCYFLGGINKGNFNTSTDNRAWTRDASEHWVAASYARADNSGSSQTSGGTRTYFDGVEKVTSTGLKWGSNQTSKITLGGTATNDSNPATGMVIKNVVIFSNALTKEQIATVTAALNAGWTVNAAGTTLTAATLCTLPGNANVQAIGSVTVAADGTLGLSGLTAVQVNNGGTLDVSAASGLTQVIVLSGGELTIGKQRPGSVVVMTGGTLNVSSTPTVSERLTGYIPTAELAVESSAYLTGTVTLDGETVTPVISGTTATLTGTVAAAGDATYTGDSWWWDYEFNGTFTSIGSDKDGMTQEGGATSFTTADASGNQELYFQKTPYRDASFSDKSELTAVMYCQPGNYANAVLVGFGSTTQGDQKAIALVTGANPSAGEMKLVLTDGHNGGTGTVTELADLTAVGATTTKHLYAFVMDRITENETTKTRIRVYLDGKVKAIYKHNGTLTLSNGFQIGSLHGGVYPRDGFNTGLSKYSATGDSGTLDFLRVIDGTLTDGAMSALAGAYPYNSAYGKATRAPVSSAANWVATGVWTQTVPGQADATQDEPNLDTNVTISKDGASDVSVAINLTQDSYYESLTLAKEAGATGSLKLTSGYGNATSGKLVSAETSVLTDTTVPGGRVHLGVTSIADGITLTVDPFSSTGNYSIYDTLTGLGFGEVYESVVISMALLGDGASVVLDETNLSDLVAAGFTAELVYNPDNLSYTFKVTREEATANISVAVDSNGVATWSTRNIPVPAPASLPSTYAGTVTITSASENPVTIATAFAGGNVTVASGGPVTLSGAITTSGNLTLNGATTLSGTSTITGAVSGSATLTVDGSVTMASTGSIANTIAGDGTLTFEALPASALSFGTWTGTVVLPELASIAGDTFSFNSYGIEGSTVRVNGIGGGWLKSEEVNPTIEIPATKTLTITAFSASFVNTFKAMSGAGTFDVTYNMAIDTTAGDWYSNYSAYFLIKDVSNFTGSLSTATPGIAIGNAKPAYNTAGGRIILMSTDAILTVSSASPEPTSGVANYSVWKSTSGGNCVYSLKNAGSEGEESYTEDEITYSVPVGWMVDNGLSSVSGLGDPAANGLTYFQCYALGLSTSDATDKPVAFVTVNGSGNFEVVLKHADGTAITRASNVQITCSLVYGDSADDVVTPQAGTTFAPPDATVRYYKVVATISPAP